MKNLIAIILSVAILSTINASAAYYGVDIYHGDSENNQIVWSTLAKEKQFVYIKSSEGEKTNDSMFTANYTSAKGVHMKWGAYHFLRMYSAKSAVTQADFFWSKIKGTGFDLVPAFDCESYDSQTTSVGVRACITAFINEFYNDSEIYPVVYSYLSYISNNSLNTYYSGRILWQAHYSTTSTTFSNWTWSIWQYSGNGSISAIANNEVDLDYAATSKFFMNYNIYTTTAKPTYNAKTKAVLQLYDANGNIVSGYKIPASQWIRINYYSSSYWEVIYLNAKKTHYVHGYIKTSSSLMR